MAIVVAEPNLDELVLELAIAIEDYPKRKDRQAVLDLAVKIDEISIHGEKQYPKDKLIGLLGYDTKGYEVRSKLHTISQNIVYLVDIGVKDIRRVVSRHPHVLELDVEKTMKPRVEYLKSIGVRDEDIGKVVSRLPHVLEFDVEKNLKPTYEFLNQNLGVAVRDIIDMPALLSYSLEGRIKPRYEFLRSKGLESRYKAGRVLTPSDEKFSKLLKVSVQEYLDFKERYLQEQKRAIAK